MERAIPLESRDEASRLFGVYDANLKRIREKTGAKITLRNGAIHIVGARPAVEEAFRAFTRVREILEARGQLAEDDLEQILEPRSKSRESAPGGYVPGSIFRRFAEVEAKSEGQQKYLAEIDTNDIVFSIGPAGTGKTFLAVAKAVQRLKAGQVRRIVLVRPAVEAGERLGFLPGDIQAKVNPYLRPIYDSLNAFLEFGQLQRLISGDVVEIVPLAYMRGRTLDEAFIILDEAQNTTSEQMKMFLTRMGGRSKIVVTGDITQIDLPVGKTSGLVEIREILKGIPGISFVHLTRADIVRHPLVQRIVDAYEQKGRRR
ncbi:MAG TPA: PhoH family protein [Planctomycetota bacterium]|jgi:phosphate starvation-inducible PhoH-like protein